MLFSFSLFAGNWGFFPARNCLWQVSSPFAIMALETKYDRVPRRSETRRRARWENQSERSERTGIGIPHKAHETAAAEYLQEHIRNGETSLHGDSGLDSADSYDEWLERVSGALTLDVRSIIFFAIRKSDRKLVGTINVRHPYQGYVRIHGHIGYGVRPAERRKGYATMMLQAALAYCRTIGLDKVLLTCDKQNVASAKTIIKCAGIFEKEDRLSDGTLVQRYWIAL